MRLHDTPSFLRVQEQNRGNQGAGKSLLYDSNDKPNDKPVHTNLQKEYQAYDHHVELFPSLGLVNQEIKQAVLCVIPELISPHLCVNPLSTCAPHRAVSAPSGAGAHTTRAGEAQTSSLGECICPHHPGQRSTLSCLKCYAHLTLSPACLPACLCPTFHAKSAH